MAPTTLRLIYPLLQDGVKALNSVEKLDAGPSSSTNQLRKPLEAIEKSLLEILVLLNRINSHHPPSREPSPEEKCVKAAVQGCSYILATINYNLNRMAAKKSPIQDTWNESLKLLEVYQKAISDLPGMLHQGKTGPQTSEDFLQKTERSNDQAKSLKEKCDYMRHQATKAGDQGQKNPPVNVLPEAQGPRKEPPKRTKAATKNAATQTSGQTTHTGSQRSSAPTQSHDNCIGYGRGLIEGRNGVCHMLKRLNIFENEAPRGKRASWLLKAIDKDEKIVGLVLELGADPNQLSSKIDCHDPTYLPLCYAAKTGKEAIVKLLIGKGAKVHARDRSGDTVLLSAASNGMVRLVELLLDEHKTDIEIRNTGTNDRKGFTPLMMAVYFGHLETAKSLLNRQANREVVDEAGNPLLHIAIGKGHLEMIKLLVEHGVQVATSDTKSGDTPLHCAIRNGSIDVGKYVMEKARALINALNNKNETPLFLAARMKMLDMIEPLIKHGAIINARNEYGYTPLHAAVLAKDMEMVGALLKEGAKVGIPNNAGQTPLHSAVVAKDIASIKVLLELGPKVDWSDKIYPRSPLHQAVIGEDPESVKTLLDLGCNMEVKDRAGKYPLQYILEMPESKASAVDLLREFLKVHERKTSFHKGFHALSKASRDGRLIFVQEILRSDPGLVTWRPPANSAFLLPLHEAIKANNKDVLEELCKTAKNLSAIDSKDHQGNTALHQSIISGRPHLIPLLIGNGADKEHPSGEADGSLPPLHLAALRMNLMAVKCLLNMGADVKRRIPGGEPCDACQRTRERPQGRDARCILRNLDPSFRSNPNFEAIDELLNWAKPIVTQRAAVRVPQRAPGRQNITNTLMSIRH
ncbi:hypothetical protein PV04_04160 [Phialophora macrospora]|uniref:Uncharacterized protein n=1 Tax=Phialophora macrospora TaxID=1851006 RepID=A0A0D2G8G5_9EURO|nr:hypothetical protein PV04_04160 [Phialophora macrospora]